jgi:hypothetical protein
VSNYIDFQGHLYTDLTTGGSLQIIDLCSGNIIFQMAPAPTGGTLSGQPIGLLLGLTYA